ncbi:hypothetical protein K491DRAFT_218994 [Lophiostoma macrostomum CBS 122681]|uniref:Uncharacterized protein n=1 Tax=Lophiostoma macrostomum CBS 122681 TaxID=1314788 RepID=A0A6A6SMY4_9PLEO|nr:hypothetical protein K491DRAFT_218994 [Lophiostoma macrostomum CBS 122681]
MVLRVTWLLCSLCISLFSLYFSLLSVFLSSLFSLSSICLFLLSFSFFSLASSLPSLPALFFLLSFLFVSLLSNLSSLPVNASTSFSSSVSCFSLSLQLSMPSVTNGAPSNISPSVSSTQKFLQLSTFPSSKVHFAIAIPCSSEFHHPITRNLPSSFSRPYSISMLNFGAYGVRVQLHFPTVSYCLTFLLSNLLPDPFFYRSQRP